jgi:hypothetical protein
MKLRSGLLCALLCAVLSHPGSAQNFPDQQYVMRIDSLIQNIETNDGLILGNNATCIMLQPDRTDGYVILKPQISEFPFDLGLPSWNGSAPDANSSFKIQMRFPYGAGWSPWLTVGYWKQNIWASYGTTSYPGGLIDIDNVKLSSYVSSWQFKIIMIRSGVEQASPTLHKLSFYISDSRTTTSLDINQIVNDKPAAIFIPTQFIYQYGVDPDIGESICSPTSVSMILRSYNIAVDPYQFAVDTHDPYFDMYGIWPRVVQNASEYGLDGAVTRYRTWSQAREVLANGGRISMSVGPPLYSGHLMMLAGFTANGDPIVHDPARTNGYSHVFDKTDLSHSWFDKGGVAYTFYQAGSGLVSVGRPRDEELVGEGFQLFQNYPNPFNPISDIRYQISDISYVRLTVYDLLGREVAVLVNERKAPGIYEVRFDGSGLASGVYLYRMQVRPLGSGSGAGTFVQTKRMQIVR